MKKSRKNYIKSCEISETAEVVLGGYKQKIAIEGKSKNLPVVVCLHGGPGSPIPFSVGCRGMFPDLTDKAVMVYWDQLGCGCNNFKLTDDFTISSFVLNAVSEGKNQKVSCKVVPRSGHMPTQAAMQAIFQEIYEMVYGAQ